MLQICCTLCSAVSEAAADQVGTIRYSLNETSREHDVTMTLIDDVIANNVTIHQLLGQVCNKNSTPSLKKTFLFSVSSPNVNGFSKFIH